MAGDLIPNPKGRPLPRQAAVHLGSRGRGLRPAHARDPESLTHSPQSLWESQMPTAEHTGAPRAAQATGKGAARTWDCSVCPRSVHTAGRYPTVPLNPEFERVWVGGSAWGGRQGTQARHTPSWAVGGVPAGAVSPRLPEVISSCDSTPSRDTLHHTPHSERTFTQLPPISAISWGFLLLFSQTLKGNQYFQKS